MQNWHIFTHAERTHTVLYLVQIFLCIQMSRFTSSVAHKKILYMPYLSQFLFPNPQSPLPYQLILTISWGSVKLLWVIDALKILLLFIYLVVIDEPSEHQWTTWLSFGLVQIVEHRTSLVIGTFALVLTWALVELNL